ncbi:LCP family protein [Brevibacillus fluminis]|uniref:LCP family protein n=1 Tax=Brevibacillus fluminis TaxID=511487 RepID=UPI003F88ED95
MLKIKQIAMIKGKKLWIGIGIAAAIGAAASWGYWALEPSHHFEHAQIPVLAQSGTPETSEPGTPGSDESQPNPAPAPAAAANAPERHTDEVPQSFNVLLLGVDTEESTVSRSDVIMVAHIVPSLKKVNLLSIPRDTRVLLPGVGYTKINHAHYLGEQAGGNHGGTEKVAETVSSFLQIPINYYAKTNFDGFRHFIDEIGGLDITLDKPVKLTWDEMTIPAGKQHLNGDMTLKFVRERYSLKNGDFDRQADQALVLKAILEKMLESQTIPKIPALTERVFQDVIDTNFSKSDIVSLAWLFENMDAENIRYMQIPGGSGVLMDPLVKREVYYWIPKKEKLRQLIDENFGRDGSEQKKSPVLRMTGEMP